jgi:hypothetical protein
LTVTKPLTTPSPSAREALPSLRCPLCGEENDCAAARTGSFEAPCWCREVVIDRQALARVPQEQRDRACLCRRCAGRLDASTRE